MVPANSRRISRVPRYSGAVCPYVSSFRLRGFHPLRPAFPKPFGYDVHTELSTVLLPRTCRNRSGLGSCAFARHYLRNHCCFLFLRVLRCFSSPGLPPALRDTVQCTVGCPIRKSVVDSGYLPLTTAYRSLSRPSSPSRAKASFMCPFLLSFFLLEFFACLRVLLRMSVTSVQDSGL